MGETTAIYHHDPRRRSSPGRRGIGPRCLSHATGRDARRPQEVLGPHRLARRRHRVAPRSRAAAAATLARIERFGQCQQRGYHTVARRVQQSSHLDPTRGIALADCGRGRRLRRRCAREHASPLAQLGRLAEMASHSSSWRAERRSLELGAGAERGLSKLVWEERPRPAGRISQVRSGQRARAVRLVRLDEGRCRHSA